MKYLLLVLALGLSACGGSDAITAPPPLAAASIQIQGPGAWVSCLPSGIGCNFQGNAQNVGSGCAGTVRGVTKFYNSAGSMVASGQWGLGTRVVRAGESFLFTTIESVGTTIYPTVTSSLTEPTWTNVGC